MFSLKLGLHGHRVWVALCIGGLGLLFALAPQRNDQFGLRQLVCEVCHDGFTTIARIGQHLLHLLPDIGLHCFKHHGELMHIVAVSARVNVVGLPVRFARKPATSTKSYTGRVVLVGIASGFRSVG